MQREKIMNKINNISFKRAAATPSLLNIEPSNAQKLDVAIEVINKYYPQNDVFLGADEKGELVYQIQKADPSIELFDTDVLTKTRTNPQELLSLINLARLYKTAYNTIHNIKEPVEKYKTKNIDRMTDLDIAKSINYSLLEFNKKYPPDKPN